METRRPIMQFRVFRVPVTLATIMKNADQEYVTWKRSDDYKKWEEDHLAGTAGCDRVMKLDCIGHVQKRLGKALSEFQKSSVKLDDGKPMKGGTKLYNL